MNYSLIQEIKNNLNIIELAEQYCKLKKVGQNKYVSHCIFHNDSEPSLYFFEDTQTFYCYGCKAGEGGADVIDFYAKANGITLKEAISRLAKQLGINFNESEYQSRIKEYSKNNEYSKQCYLDLYSNESKLEYLYSRGIDDDLIATFRLGYDSEKDAIVIPMLDKYKNTMTFIYRNLNSEPRYKNPRNTQTFKVSDHFYNINNASNAMFEKQFVYITEGTFDAMSLHKIGLTNTVSTLGTSISDVQIDFLVKNKIVPIFVYDNDDAGFKNAIKNADYMLKKYGIFSSIVKLPDGIKDPNDLILNYDAETVKQIIIDNTFDYFILMTDRVILSYETKIKKITDETYDKLFTEYVSKIQDNDAKEQARLYIYTKLYK